MAEQLPRVDADWDDGALPPADFFSTVAQRDGQRAPWMRPAPEYHLAANNSVIVHDDAVANPADDPDESARLVYVDKPDFLERVSAESGFTVGPRAEWLRAAPEYQLAIPADQGYMNVDGLAVPMDQGYMNVDGTSTVSLDDTLDGSARLVYADKPDFVERVSAESGYMAGPRAEWLRAAPEYQLAAVVVGEADIGHGMPNATGTNSATA